MNTDDRWWLPIWHFFSHVCVGSAIFLIVGTPAVALSLLVHYLPSLGVSSFIVTGMELLERAIFTVDCVLFLAYLGITGYKTLKEMWQ